MAAVFYAPENTPKRSNIFFSFISSDRMKHTDRGGICRKLKISEQACNLTEKMVY